MAKKTLSMSLVVAMLATSNVPVWASEFSAGDDVSAFSAEADAPVVENEEFADVANGSSTPSTTAPANVNKVEWKIGGKSYATLPCDAGTVTCEITLDKAIEKDRDIKVVFEDGEHKTLGDSIITGTPGDTVVVAPLLLNSSYAGKNISATVYYKAENGGYDKLNVVSSTFGVTAAEPTVAGSVTIQNTNLDDRNIICPGAVLKANIDKVDVAGTGYTKEQLHYKWQKKVDGEWTDLTSDAADPTGATYTATADDHGKEIRVGVYLGTEYYDYKTLFTTDTYKVGDRKLSANDDKGGIVSATTTINLAGGKKVIDLGDPEKNKLTVGEITVNYKNLTGASTPLTYGTDYKLSYNPEVLNTTGTVEVRVHILPTVTTDYTNDTIKLSYELTAGDSATDATDYTVTFKDTYTYNGKKQTPEVKDVKLSGASLSSSDYEVQQIGVNAGSYNLVLYVKGKGYIYVGKDGKGLATAISNEDDMPLKIEKKDLSDATVANDIKITVPDEVWTALEADVVNNSVKVNGENKKITVYDNAIDVTEEIKGFTIEALNWNTIDAKKAIRINGTNNYKGSITINGKENTRTITQFKTAFVAFFAEAGKNLKYNGKLQDVLGDKLKKGNGTINLQGTNLTVGTNFTYEIISGGTNAGNVSVRIKGAGIYSGEMELPNVYTIAKADFNSDVTNNTSNPTNLTVSYNPSLGDAGANIEAYASLAKPSYNAKITKSEYALTEGTDYWLDYKGTTTNGGSAGFGSITYTPTVKENTKLGRKEGNKNFNAADRADVTVSLVAKNLHDSDIKVRVVSADYNNGDAVMPKVEVVYVENGKEYPISSDYYYVSIKKPASAVGSTGQVNIIAKTRGTSDEAKNDKENKTVDKAKYPQLYTGNQVVDYVVGDATLEGGKIVATNDQTTLPSVAYDASAAATTEGITMPAKNYVVKDKGGNVVNPKYYDITYANNKAAGTATITATGKGQYKGTVSAQFTITANKLPSGTVTLMGDNVGKVYTGEAVELTAGKDYVVSGELGKLKLGTDYMVSYDNNVNVTEGANKAKIKFVGINNYAGELVKEFDITSAQIKAENITLGDTTYASGMAIKPSVTITVPGGKATLKEGTDYTVSYEKAATNVGETGKIVITYNKDNKNINAKDSAQTVEYGVTAKDLKDVTVAAIANQEATGEQIKPAVTVMNGSVKLTEGKDYEVVYGDNKAIGEGTVTVKALDSNKNYTGSQTVKFNIVESAAEIGTPVISSVKVVGNKATVILSGDAEGASGYDYVISTDKNCTTSKDYDAISKNQVQTSTAFKYVQKGTYYAYCHAWTRD